MVQATAHQSRPCRQPDWGKDGQVVAWAALRRPGSFYNHARLGIAGELTIPLREKQASAVCLNSAGLVYVVERSWLEMQLRTDETEPSGRHGSMPKIVVPRRLN